MESLKVFIVSEGDRSVGIPSHTIEMDLGISPKDVNDSMRDFLRENLEGTLGEVYQTGVEIRFSDEVY